MKLLTLVCIHQALKAELDRLDAEVRRIGEDKKNAKTNIQVIHSPQGMLEETNTQHYEKVCKELGKACDAAQDVRDALRDFENQEWLMR